MKKFLTSNKWFIFIFFLKLQLYFNLTPLSKQWYTEIK